MAEIGQGYGVRVVPLERPAHERRIAGADGVAQAALRPSRASAVNEWIKNYAATEGHAISTTSPRWPTRPASREELSADDLHPNAEGYAIMGPLADAAVQQALR